ncbi:pentatricopeptide repeat-containing protein At2g33760 [Amborella trichopoda]|uniref:DYW domain-containing protein n=1 Tax=Amborella trichopoda TaxID=13333 RepID=W1PGA7_AMBTC|nr:pentatricopeptide repeat-containing protein At2g33760 [Amborella trichopoda]ERN06656.1 hypothetical protein AMTR_s00058p00187000 [Amborella trichopoda]|eukprot:XP_006844981.3 pentatricopeptide repeat-containing protein At2g33760 [Amborella trichopoda]
MSHHSPTYLALLKANTNLKQLKQVHGHIITTTSSLYPQSTPLLTKLLSLYTFSGSIYHSLHIFNSIQNPDKFLYNSFIRASAHCNFPHHALLLLSLMLNSGFSLCTFSLTSAIKACSDLSAASQTGREIHARAVLAGFGPDLYVQTALVTMYAKSNDLETSRKVFDHMTLKSVTTWNAMISGYEQNGWSVEALSMLRLMRSACVAPDSATLVSALSACAQIGALDMGESLESETHATIHNPGVELHTAILTMYGRCGKVDKAREVFEMIHNPNVVSYTALISAYGMHGQGEEAVHAFERMKAHGVHPNAVTLTAVLSACAHSGLVYEGLEAYDSMTKCYGMKPSVEHRVAMVDLLGRNGFLKEAARFIESIPGEPQPPVLTAMIGACMVHKRFDMGVEFAKRLLSLEPDNPAHYVLLSNLYAASGRADRVEMVRSMMTERGLKKQPGFSSIEVKGEVHVFWNGDKSHPSSERIYEELEELVRRIRKVGYEPETGAVLHEMEDEEKEYALRFHSEKLAIVYGLMSSREGEEIRVVKNLRMCEDCHSAIKLISKVVGREILVRDKLRFHHFRDGACSCRDCW